MPCEDLTESIFVVLDTEDRLVHYVLRKESCGRTIGDESMLVSILQGVSVENILAITTESWSLEFQDDSEQFIASKHFEALRSVLNAYLGIAPAGPSASCAISEIASDESGTTIQARMKIDLPTGGIKPCGE